MSDQPTWQGGGWRPRAPAIAIRKLRLVTGLTLFTYVGTHLLNHALGNLSVAAMEAGLEVQRWIWQGVLGTAALYGALGTHYLLGLWALYQRRHFGWTRAEVVQAGLGLTIPFLLMNHLFVTRMALAQFDVQKGYWQELYSFWVASPWLGVQQVTVLIVAWIHGSIGLGMWLRLKPMFDRWKSALLCTAILLPVLALLGFGQGGRAVLAAVHDPVWRAANLDPARVGLPAQNAVLAAERDLALRLALGLLILVGMARGARACWERYRGTFLVRYPSGRQARVPIGFSLLDASRAARIPHASVCGGRARCSTCRVRIIDGTERIPPPTAGERAVLQTCGMGPAVRLACQTRPEGDIRLVPLLPPAVNAAQLRANQLPQPGEERFIVVLVADMRDSTRLATTRLPFDAVFIIDRFLSAIGSAVSEAGGRPNQFTGDGLIAMFGMDCDPAEAARRAVSAIGRIGRNMAALNLGLVAEGSEAIRFGIGVHGSPTVVGEIGYGQSRVFTTLGNAAIVATRLESLCKQFGCEAVVSEQVCSLSGEDLAWLPLEIAPIRGMDSPLPARIVHTVESLASAKV